jgi:hypothetical protein
MESRLYIGRKFTGIRVVSDEKWPLMWRIHWADGEVSDMVNLTRAKDAAVARAHIGGGAVAQWKCRRRAVG